MKSLHVQFEPELWSSSEGVEFKTFPDDFTNSFAENVCKEDEKRVNCLKVEENPKAHYQEAFTMRDIVSIFAKPNVCDNLFLLELAKKYKWVKPSLSARIKESWKLLCDVAFGFPCYNYIDSLTDLVEPLLTLPDNRLLCYCGKFWYVLTKINGRILGHADTNLVSLMSERYAIFPTCAFPIGLVRENRTFTCKVGDKEFELDANTQDFIKRYRFQFVKWN
jgi:hypothetical protein